MAMRTTAGLQLVAALFLYGPAAQVRQVPQADEPAFEVASIKKSAPGRIGVLYHLPGGRFKVERYTLLNLIHFSFDVPNNQIVGLPEWASTERFDIEATAGGPAESDPKKMETSAKKAMVRNLLAERFGLQVRREQREAPVYALTVAPKGPKLAVNVDKRYSILAGKRSFTFTKVSMADFAAFLTTSLYKDIGRTIVDRTQITGDFDFKLTWMPVADEVPSRNSPTDDPAGAIPNSTKDDPPPIFTALQQELGLKLVPERALQSFVVVIHAALPSDN
jgi:uncharacterized protein (TIGR03435 family)